MAGVTRRWLAVGVLALWVVGLGLLTHREYFRPHLERLAESATRISPSTIYFSVERDGQQIGYASSVIDTATTAITMSDAFTADVPAVNGVGTRRTTVATRVELSRTLRVRQFGLTAVGPGTGLSAKGRADGDSIMAVTVFTRSNDSVTHRVHLDEPILLSSLIPLAVALSDDPHVGKQYTLPIFDPVTLSVNETALSIRAESVFVVNDSAVFDSVTKRWRGITPDTVRAWQVTSASPHAFAGWIDARGRVVETTQLGFELRRVPYEVAFVNWRLASGRCRTTSPPSLCR